MALSLDMVFSPPLYFGSITGIPIGIDFGVINPSQPLDPEPDPGPPAYPGFSWDYGDGNADTGVTGPSHGYTAYGSYNVTLTLREIGSTNLSSFQQTLRIFDLNIGASPALGKKPLLVNFSVSTVAASYVPVTYFWDFRDGGTGLAANVSHLYTSAGEYDVVLITDQGLPTQVIFSSDPGYPGVNVVVPGLKIIVSDLSADYTVTPSNGYLPFTGVFNDTSIGSVTGYQWDFDDGSPPLVTYDPEVIHNYSTPGVYNPLMTAYDVYGLTDTHSEPITVVDDLGINVSLSDSNVTSEATFTPQNDFFVTEWTWRLTYEDVTVGDIVVEQVTTTNPSEKVYVKELLAPGDYRIKLTVLDDQSAIQKVEESFSVSENVVINTVPFVLVGEEPFSVSFFTSNAEYDDVDVWEWDFNGDGSTDSTNGSDTYVYNDPGSFSANLKLTWIIQDFYDTELSATVEVTKSKLVSVGAQDLGIDFTASPSQGHIPLNVMFTGISNNPVSTWLWVLHGVGPIGNTQQIQYQFTQAGIYFVTLTVEDEFGGGPVSVSKSILVASKLSTFDVAPSPSILISLEGSGQIIPDTGKGVFVSVPAYATNPDPLGFTRNSGPTLIYD